MARGGRLERLCRHTYETLLLRSRGYGMSKAVLGAVAEEEGLNLTALVGRLGRSPGAIRDYLGWLLGVDALRMVGKRYFYVDGTGALVGPAARRRRAIPDRRASSRRPRARSPPERGRGAGPGRRRPQRAA